MMQNNEFKLFSKNLKQLLKKNNMKNIDLANSLGVSKSAISNYLSGSMPKMKTIADIADFFGVSYDYLIGHDIDTANIKLNESGKLVYSLPLFQKKLMNTEVIYRANNYIGEITSPIPIYEDLECYALMTYDDSMVSYGIANGCLAVFSTTQKPADGDIAAVLIKSKKTIIVTSVKSDSKSVTLTDDKGSKVYKKTKDGCDAIVLGKILYATFYPNNQA